MAIDMRMSQYAKRARRLAIYPLSYSIIYPTLGIAGELGELMYKFSNDARDDDVRSEMGDVLWYIANTATDCNIGMETLFPECETFGQVEVVPFRLSNLLFAIGAVCGLAKKMIRDDAGKLTAERQERIKVALGCVLISLASLATFRDWSLAEIAKENLEKLASRQKRDTLKGDGDNR